MWLVFFPSGHFTCFPIKCICGPIHFPVLYCPTKLLRKFGVNYLYNVCFSANYLTVIYGNSYHASSYGHDLFFTKMLGLPTIFTVFSFLILVLLVREISSIEDIFRINNDDVPLNSWRNTKTRDMAANFDIFHNFWNVPSNHIGNLAWIFLLTPVPIQII